MCLLTLPRLPLRRLDERLPLALHGSTITDFAPGHSLVAALQGAGMRRVFVTDWRSARPHPELLSFRCQ